MKTLAFFCVLMNNNSIFESDGQTFSCKDLDNTDEDNVTDNDKGEDCIFSAEMQVVLQDNNC